MSMMEIIELMKQRRSVRSYTDEAVSDEVLDTILETATYAPTGGGKQSPVIVAVKDRETRDLISRLNAKVMGGDTDPFYGAPVIVIVLADGTRGSYVEDGSGVLNYIMRCGQCVGCQGKRNVRFRGRQGAFEKMGAAGLAAGRRRGRAGLSCR